MGNHDAGYDELWASGLRSVKERMVPLFTQKRVAASACAFLDVLIGNEPRKTGLDARGSRRRSMVHGGSRRFWGAGTGMPMPFVMSSEIM